jgi:uncharacterized protein (UPF0332 family)
VISLDELNELYYQGMLKKVEPSPLRSTLSLKEGRLWLKEAVTSFENGTYRSARVCTYLAFLHAARSVPLRDGVQEKNPLSLVPYLEKYNHKGQLEEKWPQILDWIFSLHYQDKHQFQAMPTPEEVKMAIDYGHEFIQRINHLLKDTGTLPRTMTIHPITANEKVK